MRAEPVIAAKHADVAIYQMPLHASGYAGSLMDAADVCLARAGPRRTKMTSHIAVSPHWNTAAVGLTEVALQTDLAALQTQLRLHMCQPMHRQLLTLRPVAHDLRGFVTAHSVTSLALGALLTSALCAWW